MIASALAILKNFLRSVKRVVRDAIYLYYYYKAPLNPNLILIESKHGEDLADNMFYILQEAHRSYPGYELALSVTQNSRTKLEALLVRYEIGGVALLQANMPAYCKALATAKYLFNDTTFRQFFIKREGQIYTNTWHGTPLKRMGNDDVNRRYKMGNVLRNLVASDYLVFSNAQMQEKMVNAYGLKPLYRGEILKTGSPRNSVLLDHENRLKKRNELMSLDHSLKDKKLYVYMPTYRDDLGEDESEAYYGHLWRVFDYIDNKLNDDELLFVSLHVLAQKKLDLSKYKNIRIFPESIETYEFLTVSDALITDYSSLMFDYLNTGQKVILFVHDLEDYCNRRGLYYDIETLPFPKVRTAEDLLLEVRSPKTYDDTELIQQFCTYDCLGAPKVLLDYVIARNQSKNLVSARLEKPDKPVSLVYVSYLGLNGMTTSLLSLLSIIDTAKADYFFCFRDQGMARHPQRVQKLPLGSKIFPMAGELRFTLSEIVAFIGFYHLNINASWVRTRINRLLTREGQRFFGEAIFDQVIHFTGYESWVTGMLQRLPAESTIFVHNDKVAEFELRRLDHRQTFHDAFKNFNHVAIVSEAMRKPTVQIGGREDNIVLVENAHNAQRVLGLSKEDINFDPDTESTVSKDALEKFLASDALKIINIARFSPEKGQRRLMDAFDTFVQRGQDAYLILIGGYGETYADLKNYARNLGCADRIVILKSLSNPYSILTQCNVFVLSSQYEGLGLVLLEAATLGIPSISTDIPGAADFMRQHGGWVVPNSREGLLQGLEDFSQNKISPMNFDVAQHNERVRTQFELLFRGPRV